MSKVRWVLLPLVMLIIFTLAGCACSAGPKKPYGDLQIGIIVKMPLSYYYGQNATLIVRGPHGLRREFCVPMDLGNQIVMVRNVPAGQYVLSLHYGGMVATKCVLFCATCEVSAMKNCLVRMKNELKGAPEDVYSAKGLREGDPLELCDDRFLDFETPPGDKIPCQTSIIFCIPDDMLKYDP